MGCTVCDIRKSAVELLKQTLKTQDGINIAKRILAFLFSFFFNHFVEIYLFLHIDIFRGYLIGCQTTAPDPSSHGPLQPRTLPLATALARPRNGVRPRVL